MPVQGNLATMSLTEILQWLGNAGKTGTLSVERNKVVKQILLREGRVIACSSQEPSDMLGHFLVSRGRISEETLRAALERQRTEKFHLGALLVSMGALTEEDLGRILEDKSQETIFGLFEWEDAEFRYVDGETVGAHIYPVDMRVEDILLRGAQRWDEIRRIRQVFDDPGIVLQLTGKSPPSEVLKNRMAQRILNSVDGERTVAEILLNVHASEYLVTKFLYRLHMAGVAEIIGRRSLERKDEPVLPPAEDLLGPVAKGAGETPARSARSAVAVAARPAAPTLIANKGDLEVASRLLNRGDFEAALDILDRAYKSQPGDESLRRLLAEAEAAFIDKAQKHYLPATKMVSLPRPLSSLSGEALTPNEVFLLSRIDNGSWDVRSIIQITPLREIDVLRTLKKMREKGLIELKDPVHSVL